MSGWRDHIAAWLERPGDTHLAERLARAVEEYRHAGGFARRDRSLRGIDAALTDYRARHPREDA